MNPILERLQAQRAEQIQFVDTLLNRVEADGRDLVDAEQANLAAARERIAALDAQLGPIREFEDLRGASAAGAARALGSAGEAEPRALGGGRPFPYATAGAFIVDHLRARGIPKFGVAPDPAAAARLLAAVDNQTTADTPGLLPVPVVGDIINTLDPSRPFITSIGARPMGNIAGSTFNRPKITQHALAGKQSAEKTQLPSRRMIIGQVPFVKGTYGGTVDISRQDIDWTSPSAWDALVRDLAAVYGLEVEEAATTAFVAAVTQSVAAADSSLTGIASALYEAAALCYRGGAAAGAPPAGQLPNRLWVSLDMWALMGAVVDTARMQIGANATGSLGSSDITQFAGDILNAPRIVVPSFPDGTAILGPSTLTEFYEEVVGLLTAVEPALFGIEAAYGGYAAFGTLEANAYCKITVTPPVGRATVTTTRKSGNGQATTPEQTSPPAGTATTGTTGTTSST